MLPSKSLKIRTPPRDPKVIGSPSHVLLIDWWGRVDHVNVHLAAVLLYVGISLSSGPFLLYCVWNPHLTCQACVWIDRKWNKINKVNRRRKSFSCLKHKTMSPTVARESHAGGREFEFFTLCYLYCKKKDDKKIKENIVIIYIFIF